MQPFKISFHWHRNRPNEIKPRKTLLDTARCSAPAYVAMCHYLFDTAEDFMAAFMPHAPELQGDMPNYTDIATVIQVSAVAISH